MTKTRTCGTAGWFLCALCICSPARLPAQDLTARDLFDGMNRRYADISSLAYTVARTTVSGTQSMEEKWDFRFKAPGLIKVEYHSPGRRLIFISETNLWEYIPAAGKAMRTDLAALPEGERASRIASVMARVAVDGLRLGDTAGMLERVTRTSRRDDGLYVIEGENPKFIIHADGDRQCLVHSELYDDAGELTLQTDASDFIEAGRGIWLPRNVSARYRTKDGPVSTRTVLTNLRINDDPADAIFRFTVPEGVSVVAGN